MDFSLDFEVGAFFGGGEMGESIKGSTLPAGVQAFAEWLLTQGQETRAMALEHLTTIALVLSEKLLLLTPWGPIPDVWSMAEAAQTLKGVARQAGFSEAVDFFEAIRVAAQDLITEIG
jgi:hypothetical protein